MSNSLENGETLVCESELTHVVVHESGAVITRRVRVPEQATGNLILEVNQVTPDAAHASVRVVIPSGKATLVSVRSAIHVPKEVQERGPTVEELEVLRATFSALEDQLRALRERDARWRNLSIAPSGRSALNDEGPQGRTRAALALAELASDRRGLLGEKIRGVLEELENLQRQIHALELEDAQRSNKERQGAGHPTTRFLVQLSQVDGLKDFELSYTVPQARWWPSYALHLSDGDAQLLVEAVVAQSTGEDWSGVSLALSTAVLSQEVRLPELFSLRLGRSQRPPPKGYRDAPDGLEKLFASYDLASGYRMRESTPQVMRAQRAEPAAYDMELDDMTDYEAGAYEEEAIGAPMQSAYAPPPPAAAPAPMRSAPRGAAMVSNEMVSMGMVRSRLAGAPGGPADGFGGAAYDSPIAEPAHQGIEPASGWLNFDELRLGSPSSGRRGQLERHAPDFSGRHIESAKQQASSQGLVPPLDSKGNFDYRYDAEGLVNIPADALLHRVRLLESKTKARLNWRTVPKVEAAVYREVTLDNPLELPLLSGPVRVFVDGQLRVQTELKTVDIGGEIKIGLGVDDNLQVVRNARMEEDGAGIFGGKRELLHHISIELSSSLGFPAKIEVIDRKPITDDKEVEVELVRQEPRALEYEQKERPVRGGLKWLVTLGPGGKQEIEFSYRVVIKAKDELIGGNRRD